MDNGLSKLSSRIFAVIVGIDTYRDAGFPRLRRAVSDAKNLAHLLIEDLKVPEDHITQLYDNAATKDAIISAITNTPKKDAFQPGHAILFFYSGLAGQASEDVGMICPVDVNVESQTGISDSTLSRLFDQISRSYGDNITLLMDCDSDIFHWENPSSFVVLTPKDATETETGATFTESLINVLKLEKKYGAIPILTVQSFAAKIQANKCPITCLGRNTDRFLFNRASGEAYHSFILAEAGVGEDGKLKAGLAHGILPGTKLDIFYSNVKEPRNEKFGQVVVKSAEATTSILGCSLGNSDPLPSIFYAVETHYPADEVGKIVRILAEDPPAGFSEPLVICGAGRADQPDDANLTLKFLDGEPSLSWNGAKGDPKFRGDLPIDVVTYPTSFETTSERYVRMLKKATRFSYHLLRVSPGDSLLEKNLHVQLLNIEGSQTAGRDTENPTGDLFKDSCAQLKQSEFETLGPFCLDILNNSKDDLWLYIFTLDPSPLNIIPWYPSSSSGNHSPLKAGGRLRVGSGDDKGSRLSFRWTADENEKVQLSYIKVFATAEQTDFSLLMQQYLSPTEDRVRKLKVEPFVDPRSPLDQNQDAMGGGMEFVTGSSASWASLKFTIIRTLI